MSAITVWTKDEEASALDRRFGSLNRREFAEKFQVPGGASMISQHTKGHRPISLEAALAYARGFGVMLDDISPRLAELLRSALPMLKPQQASGTPTPPPSAWPFGRHITQSEWASLLPEDQAVIAWEARRALEKLQPSGPIGKRAAAG